MTKERNIRIKDNVICLMDNSRKAYFQIIGTSERVGGRGRPTSGKNNDLEVPK